MTAAGSVATLTLGGAPVWLQGKGKGDQEQGLEVGAED